LAKCTGHDSRQWAAGRSSSQNKPRQQKLMHSAPRRLSTDRAYFVASWRLNQFYAFLAIVNDECVVFSQSGPRAAGHVAKSDEPPVGHIRLPQSEIVSHTAGETSRPAPLFRLDFGRSLPNTYCQWSVRNGPASSHCAYTIRLPFRIATQRSLQVETAGPWYASLNQGTTRGASGW